MLMATEQKHVQGLKAVLAQVIDDAIADLRNLTPKDTGAAAGAATGRPMTPSHPGYGLPIGNFEGATGWQPYMSDNGKQWSITNPMWEPYLKYRNYLGGAGSNFVEVAVQRMRERIRNMRKH
jgi:hypothetical protein